MAADDRPRGIGGSHLDEIPFSRREGKIGADIEDTVINLKSVRRNDIA